MSRSAPHPNSTAALGAEVGLLGIATLPQWVASALRVDARSVKHLDRFRWRPHWNRCAAAAFAVFASCHLGFAACAPMLNEHELKAAAIYNIILFTEWPASAFASPGAPLVIGVVGRGPVADVLESMVQTTSWRGHAVVLQRYGTAADIKRCHVLFIGASEHQDWSRIRARIAEWPVMAVGAAPDFAQNGGTVQLSMERNRLRLIVNLRALNAAGLSLSSQVLRLAEVIGD